MLSPVFSINLSTFSNLLKKKNVDTFDNCMVQTKDFTGSFYKIKIPIFI